MPRHIDDTDELPQLREQRRVASSERANHWIQLALSMIASAATSGMVVSYTLGQTMSKLQTENADMERRMDAVEKQTIKNGQTVAAIVAREDGTDQFRLELLHRLDNIEAKLDRAAVPRR